MEQLFYCTLSAIFGGAIGAAITIYFNKNSSYNFHNKLNHYTEINNENTNWQLKLNREMMDGIKMCQNEILQMKNHRFK